MAKKQGNMVILDGKFKMEKIGKVNFCVCTDDEKHGGHHHVLAYDRLAEEIVATVKAFNELTEFGRVIPDLIGGGQMEVSVHGWLRTYSDSTVVIAESVRFHTYEVVRKYANLIQVRKVILSLSSPDYRHSDCVNFNNLYIFPISGKLPLAKAGGLQAYIY